MIAALDGGGDCLFLPVTLSASGRSLVCERTFALVECVADLRKDLIRQQDASYIISAIRAFCGSMAVLGLLIPQCALFNGVHTGFGQDNVGAHSGDGDQQADGEGCDEGLMFPVQKRINSLQ